MRRLGVLALLVVLTSCGNGGDDEAADKDPEPTTTASTASSEPSVVSDARYGTVEDLRDAAVAAGYDCKRWKQDNVVTLAASSGHCSDADVFAVYATETDRDDQVQQQREFSEEFGMEMESVLVGPNWTINSPTAGDLRDELGGVLFGG